MTGRITTVDYHEDFDELPEMSSVEAQDWEDAHFGCFSSWTSYLVKGKDYKVMSYDLINGGKQSIKVK